MIRRLLIVGAAALSFSAPAAAKIDCNGSDPTAMTVCNSGLTSLDTAVDSAFGSALASLPAEKRSALSRSQEAWERERRACGPFVMCLEEKYQQRLAVLRSRGHGLDQDAASTPAGEFEPAADAASAPEAEGRQVSAPSAAAAPSQARPRSAQARAEDAMWDRIERANAARAAAAPEASSDDKFDATSTRDWLWGTVIVGAGALVIALFFLPTIIAFRRGHGYRWIILVINILGAWTAVGWIFIFAWAVWPATEALAAPVVDNAIRPSGGSLEDNLQQLEALGRLRASGVLTEAEFEARKAVLLS